MTSQPFRLLHFAPDDKFIPLQQDLFDVAFPGANEFRVTVSGGGQPKHVVPAPSVRVVSSDYFDGSADLVADLDRADCVFCHSLTLDFMHALPAIPRSKLVVWSAWGVEYFGLLDDERSAALLPQTDQLLRELSWEARRDKLTSVAGMKSALRSLAQRARPKPTTDVSGLADVAHRIDVMSINPIDEPRLQAVIPSLSAVNHLLPYYTTEDTLEPGPATMTGPDILVGNSASPTNNHLEVLDLLRTADLSGRRVIVPLSYGYNDQRYVDRVCMAGEEWLGEAFTPLREFMTLEAYNQTVSGCGTVAMNHVRQQALGTISSAFYKGAAVYLRPESPLTSFMTNLGITVHPLSNIGQPSTDVQDDATRNRNAAAIGEFWSRANAISQIRGLETRAADLAATG